MELCYIDGFSTQHFIKHYPSRSAGFIQNSNIVASLWIFSRNETAIHHLKCEVQFEESEFDESWNI